MKIQYKSQLVDIKSDKRYLLYRIIPTELSWFKRIFNNPWRYVYTTFNVVFRTDNSINDCLRFLFSEKEANEIISKYDTYEKITDFLTSEFNKAKTLYNEAQEKYVNQNKSWKF